MLHSFRLKIGLMSMFLSGVLLIGFGIFSISVLNRVGLERIDRELRALADAQVRKIQPRDHWQRFDDSLRSIYGDSSSKQFVVMATRSDGDQLYATANWPQEIPLNSLPLSLGGATESTPEGPAQDNPPPPNEELGGKRPRPFDEPSPRSPPPRRIPVRGPVFATLGGMTAEWRAMTLANEDVTLSIAMNLASLHSETRRFHKALLVTIPLGLLLIIGGGWLIGHMVLRPVNLIARTAELVTTRRLDERIPGEGVDMEFKHLIKVINGMLERIEKGFQQATRFSADAAHELKTPLAILQAQMERSLQRAADGTAEQREYVEQLDEVQRLKAILRKLLLLSQADAGELPLSIERINLADIVRAAVDDIQMLAPDRMTTVTAPAELFVPGDSHLLSQVIQNLISNAVKFGDRNGSIEMTLVEQAYNAVFTITNNGLPIPTQDHNRIFARFYRADKSHSREIEGSGLGLSLAREIAQAHGGELILARSDEHMTSFALSLPLARQAYPMDIPNSD